MLRKTVYETFIAGVAACLLALPLPSAAQMVDPEIVVPGAPRIIDAHSICKVVTNNNENDVMVPVQAVDEWALRGESFLETDLIGMAVKSCDYRMNSITSYINGDYCGIDFGGSVWCWMGTRTSYGNTAKQIPTKIKNIANAQSVTMGWQSNCASVIDGRVFCFVPSDFTTTSTYGTKLTGIKDIGMTFEGSVTSPSSDDVTCGITLNNRGIKCSFVRGYDPSRPVYNYTTTKTISKLHIGDNLGCFLEDAKLRCFKPMTARNFAGTIRDVNGAPADVVEILTASLNDIIVQTSNGSIVSLTYDGRINFQSFVWATGQYPTDADWASANYSYQRPPLATRIISGFSATPLKDKSWAFGRIIKAESTPGTSFYREVIRTNSDGERQACAAVGARNIECRNYSGTSARTIYPAVTIPGDIKAIEATEDYYIDRPNTMCALTDEGAVWCLGEGISATPKMMRFQQ
jgi:hypothetical protein